MDQPLSSVRKAVTGYSTSKSLYGGDITVDDDLDQYFKQKTPKKKRKSVSGHSAGQAPAFNAFEQNVESVDISGDPIVGRCRTVEKDYYRLTSAPSADSVRPVSVLSSALSRVKQRWIEANDYAYCCNQLKSIRQDLTVQHIKSAFTVEVYEIHGRIALETGDFGEFGQCQSQLHQLYKSLGCGHRAEFSAYKILHFLKWNRWNDVHLIDFIDFELSEDIRSDPAVAHAIALRKALALNSYVMFFRLYQETPNMGIYLLDSVAERMRLKALNVMIHAYRPKLDVQFIAKVMAFENAEECTKHLKQLNLVFASAPSDNWEAFESALDTKQSQPIIEAIFRDNQNSNNQVNNESNAAASVNPVELTLAQRMAMAMGFSSGGKERSSAASAPDQDGEKGKATGGANKKAKKNKKKN